LSQLKCLFLSDNQIKSIPSEIRRLTDLESLVIHANQLLELPGEISDLKNLRRLGVRENPDLTNLPISLGKLTHIEFISTDVLDGSVLVIERLSSEAKRSNGVLNTVIDLWGAAFAKDK
jgi:nitrogen fixation protein